MSKNKKCNSMYVYFVYPFPPFSLHKKSSFTQNRNTTKENKGDFIYESNRNSKKNR